MTRFAARWEDDGGAVRSSIASSVVQGGNSDRQGDGKTGKLRQDTAMNKFCGIPSVTVTAQSGPIQREFPYLRTQDCPK